MTTQVGLTAQTPTLDDSRRFHLAAGIGCGLFFIFSISGCRAALIDVSDMGPTVLEYSILAAALCPLLLYWQKRGRTSLRDGTLVILWTFVFRLVIEFPFLIAARLTLPLRDDLLMRIDTALGYSPSAVVLWAQHSQLGSLLNHSYDLLPPFLISAAAIPALFGRPQAKTFLLANIIAAAIALPCFALVPAIGPGTQVHSPQPLVSSTAPIN